MHVDNLRQAAFNAADGNDDTDWDLLNRGCPEGSTLADFIESLLTPTASQAHYPGVENT